MDQTLIYAGVNILPFVVINIRARLVGLGEELLLARSANRIVWVENLIPSIHKGKYNLFRESFVIKCTQR